MSRKMNVGGTAIVLVGLLGWGASGALAAPATQAGGQNFTAMIGQEIFTTPGQKAAWQAIKFYPKSITVNVGDSVTWMANAGGEPHTVSFLGGDKYPEFVPSGPPPGAGGPPSGPPSGPPPKIPVNPLAFFPQGGATFSGKGLTSSGVLASDIPGPKQYKLTFTTAGTYEYMCLIHTGVAPDGTIQGMKASVVVQAAGSAYPMTAAQVVADEKAAMAADVTAASAAEAKMLSQPVASHPGANGGTVYSVQSGGGLQAEELEYQRFLPRDLTVNVGDTVEWSSFGFHTVTFGGEPELFIIEPQKNGPPNVYFNGEVALPSGGPTYSGTGFNNSGIISAPPGSGPDVPGTFSLTFTGAGRFEYICAVHYHQGMDGSITVRERTGGGTPGMPRTGNSFDWLGAALAGLVLAASGFALRLRNSRAASK